MRDSSKIEKQLEMVSLPIPLPTLVANINLNGFPAAQNVIDCFERKEPFGLQMTGSAIIFDPNKLIVYDYSEGIGARIDCRNQEDFITYIKLAIVEHKTFMKAQTCVDYIKSKNIPEKKLITNI